MKEISICIGSACHVRGSFEVVEKFKALVKENNLEDQVELVGSFCMDACSDGVAVKYNDIIHSVKPEGVEALFKEIMEMD